MSHGFIELDKAVVHVRASLVAQRLKRLPARWETQVRSLGWEDLMEKIQATHPSIIGFPLRLSC